MKSPSYDHSHDPMKYISLLLVLATLPSVVRSQVDTTRADTSRSTIEEQRAVSLGWSSKEGLQLEVIQPQDTTKAKEPVIIELKRKTIRIYSEDKTPTKDSVNVAERLKEKRTERRNLFTYWSGLDIGVNTLMDASGNTNLQGDDAFMRIDEARSRFFSLNFMEQKIEFGSHHVGLLTGLGWEFTNYHLKNNVLLAYNADSIYGIPVETPEFRKNKLRQMGFRVPLMLEFNTKRAPLPTEETIRAGKNTSYDRKGNFHLAAGLVGTWYFDTMYKQKYVVEGDRRKDRDKGDHLLLPYRAAASVRLGYGGLNLFAEYALTPLFREGKGPELTPLNVGITLVGFN